MRSHSQQRDQSSDPMAIMFVMNIDPFDSEDGEMSESSGSQLATSSRPRPTRPPYSEEHLFFIWYARTDLGLSWRQVTRSFDDVFPGDRQQGGLQCRYYRTLKYWGVPAVRDREAGSLQDQRTQPVPRRYGVIERTSRRYPWMFVEHQNTPCLPEFAQWSSHR